MKVQCCPMVCLGSKGMDHVIKGQFYIGHFPMYNSFSKFDSKNIRKPQHDHVILKSMNYISMGESTKFPKS